MIASTNTELMRLMPRMPPAKSSTEKYILANTPIVDELFAAISSGRLYHPSMVNKRKIEYRLIPVLPKWSGQTLPNSDVVDMETTNNNTTTAIHTSNDDCIAFFIPLATH